MLFSTPSAFLVVLSTWCFALAVQPSWATVDTSSPNLGMYALRRIGDKGLTKQRAGQPIDDLATGALHMHESFFVRSNAIKCPAYAHLFKLIKLQNSSPPLDFSEAIRQNVIESLAVVVTYDRILYHKMFLQSVESGEAADNFAEAVEAMEARKALEGSENAHVHDAWLDLIECISEYMLGNSRAKTLMSDPSRSQAVAAAEKSKSNKQPVNSDSPPEGIVEGLKSKFEGLAKTDNKHVNVVNYDRARVLIDRIEGADIAGMKQRIVAEQEQPGQQSESQPERLPVEQPEEHANPRVSADKVQPKEAERIASVEVPKEPELVVSSKSEHDEPLPDSGKGDEAEACTSSFCSYQLDILEFIKMRLEMKPAKRFDIVPRLSMQLALDFQSHWDDLAKAHLNTNTNWGRRALQFREDPANVELAGRVNAAISKYVKIVSKIAEIRMQEDRMKDMDLLRQSTVDLGEYLSTFDSSFDVDELRQVYELWKPKYNSLVSVGNFINGGW